MEEGLFTTDDILAFLRTNNYILPNDCVFTTKNFDRGMWENMTEVVLDDMANDDLARFIIFASKSASRLYTASMRKAASRVDRSTIHIHFVLACASNETKVEIINEMAPEVFLKTSSYFNSVPKEACEYLDEHRFELAEFPFETLIRARTTRINGAIQILMSIILINYEDIFIERARGQPGAAMLDLIIEYEKIKGEPFRLDDVDSFRWIRFMNLSHIYSRAHLPILSEKMKKYINIYPQCDIKSSDSRDQIQAFVDLLD